MLEEKAIAALEKDGWARWTKGKYDRMYFNAEKNGVLDLDYYNSGNIRSAAFNGEKISNSAAYRIKSIKLWVDVKDGKIWTKTMGHVSEEDDLVACAKKSLAKAQ